MIHRRKSISSSGGFPSPMERCSIASLSSTSIDEEDSECVHGSFLERIRNMFCFDALNLQSTAVRNATMKKDHSSVSYISHYGNVVCFTDKYHYTASELEPYRLVGDLEMDRLLSQTKNVGAFDDIIAVSAAAYRDPTSDETSKHLAEFYRHYEEVPTWVDFDQLQRGIDVFLAYLPAAGCSLYYRSLVGGFSIPVIVEVLKSTRYLISDRKKTLERLIDTGGLLAACFAPTINGPSAASLRPGGQGWMAALRVKGVTCKGKTALASEEMYKR